MSGSWDVEVVILSMSISDDVGIIGSIKIVGISEEVDGMKVETMIEVVQVRDGQTLGTWLFKLIKQERITVLYVLYNFITSTEKTSIE